MYYYKFTLYKEHKTLRWIQFDFLNRFKLLRFMASCMCARVMSITGVPSTLMNDDKDES